ncbi:MAG: bifunctional ADP-dependent NAD(P)H-hydrate dehydratase/NAD(P)H-hydrate epimerase, partial [Actinomycetes bacterium]
MIPVLTPAEMAAVDRAAPEPVDVLVRRAAGAVARTVVGLLGGTYGRRVVVVAGPGNNGNDGRVAAELLRARGVRCTVLGVAGLPEVLPPCDLVVDAAYGTGFRGEFALPDTGGAPVLAVDVPSGVSGQTGEVGGRPARAVATVTFAALKPGLLLGDGPAYAGQVEVADIGLDVSGAAVHLVEDADVVAWVPDRAADAHKWHHAVAVVAGSPGMTGAAVLSATAALRTGAGYVRLTVPGAPGPVPGAPVEVVEHPAALDDPDAVLADLSRFAALVVGPGLGRSEGARALVAAVVARAELPLVVDGDGLRLLGDRSADLCSARPAPTVLTPHDAEFESLAGAPPGRDRLAAVQELSARTGCTVLLKGPTTV